MSALTASMIERNLAGLSFDDYPPGSDDAATTYLLLPSLGVSRRSWTTSAEYLRAHARVLNVDPPGHGDSPMHPHFLTVTGLAQRYRDLLDELDIDKCVVVGNSMGAAVAVALAELAPHQVSALVLVGAFVAADEAERAEWLASRSEAMLSPTGELRAMSVDFATKVFGRYDAELHSFLLTEHIRCSRSMAPDLWALYSFDLQASLCAVHQPTLAIYGELDYLRETSGPRLLAVIEHADSAVIKDGSHLTPVDRPIELAAGIAAWVEQTR